MHLVLQRVSSAQISVQGLAISNIQRGLLVLLGVENGDEEADAKKMAEKVAALRVFEDTTGKLNRSVIDSGGAVLVVSNFTLCADCSHGRRPSFSTAASRVMAEPLYEAFCRALLENGVVKVEKGQFGADMQVMLVNDGPVTIYINSREYSN
jgi:D-tyrosyl-tRNA(Tyr) deacylase